MTESAAGARRAFVICLFALVLANFDHALFTYVLPQLTVAYGWSDIERGWYIALTFVAAGLAITQLGVLADRVGRKRVLLATLILAPWPVVAMIWAPSTLALLGMRTVGFVAAGAAAPLTGTIVVEESPSRLRGLLSGVLQIGYPLGFTLAAVVVYPILHYYPDQWRWVFALPLLTLPYAWVVARSLREPPAWQRIREARGSAPPPSTAVLFLPEYRYRTVILFLGQFLQVFAYGASLLLIVFFVEARGWKPEDATLLIGVSYGIGSLGYVLAAVAGEFWMSRRNVIVIWCWLGAAAFAALIWLADGWWPTVLAFGATTFFFYGATAVIFTFLAESFPAEVRGTAVAFSGSFGVMLGVALGPLALSYLAVARGWPVAYTICGVLPVFLAGWVYLLAKPVPRTNID
jgi:SHS family lactate transporter-like MFS transporter